MTAVDWNAVLLVAVWILSVGLMHERTRREAAETQRDHCRKAAAFWYGLHRELREDVEGALYAAPPARKEYMQ